MRPTLLKNAVIASAGLLLGAALTLFWFNKSLPKNRPRYLFKNDTSWKAHDLALKMSLKLAEKQSGVENALILLKELPSGQTIEEAAHQLFEKFEVGKSREGRGILYLYAQKENQFRMEVSYELEGLLPDVSCRQLEEAAKTYMLSEIAQDFLSELLITVNQSLKSNHVLEASGWTQSKEFSDLSGGGGASVSVASKDIKVVRTIASKKNNFVSSRHANEVVSGYLKSLELGIGDPNLDILTPGSQQFRKIVPRNVAQQHRVYRAYEKSLPYHLFENGSWAIALFEPKASHLPIVLRRDAYQKWRVDEVKAWTWFHRWEDGAHFYPKYEDTPFNEALRLSEVPQYRQPIYQGWVGAGGLASETDAVSKLKMLQEQTEKNPKQAKLWASLGETYLFEFNWLSRSIEAYEKASQLEPNEKTYHWRLWDLYLNHSEMERALGHLKVLTSLDPTDDKLNRWFKYYDEQYRFKPGEF